MRIIAAKSAIIFSAILLLSLMNDKASASTLDGLDGNELLKSCGRKNEMPNDYCNGYVYGLTAGIMMFEGSVRVKDCKTGINTYDAQCVEKKCAFLDQGKMDGMTQGQVVDVFKIWLINHPERRHDRADFLFLAALKEAFPCPKN